MSAIGHNSGNVISMEERKAFYINEITSFVDKVRKDRALHYDEIAQVDSLGRLFIQRQAMLDNMRQYYAVVPNADVGPGVLTLVTLLCDNSQGYCSASVQRMADFLSRSRRAVGQAIQRLVESGCLKIEEGGGARTTHRLWPVVHPMFVNNKDPLTWALDAHTSNVSAAKAASQQKSRVASEGAKLASRRKYTDAKAASRLENNPDISTDKNPDAKAASRLVVVLDAKPASRQDALVAHADAKAASHNTTITNTTLRDSPLTPESVERGVWGESEFASPPTPSPSAPPKKVAQATEGSAQKAKRSASELVVKPDEVVEAEVLKPGEGFGAAGAQLAKADGGAAGSDRKRPARRFPTDLDERKRLGAYCRQYALAHDMDEATFRLEVKQWADRAESRDERYVSWEAAWRTWVANWRKWQRPAVAARQSRAEVISDAAEDALRAWKEKQQ